MPCNLDDETLSRYVVTHEYGHMLENFLPQQDMTGTIYTHQQKCEHYRNEILNIAKNLDENFSIDNFLSEYGSTNDKEFFAECFANSQLGQPNVLGNAMLIWLERRGFNVYWKKGFTIFYEKNEGVYKPTEKAPPRAGESITKFNAAHVYTDENGDTWTDF